MCACACTPSPRRSDVLTTRGVLLCVSCAAAARFVQAILRHFREERAERSRLLGDAPLPAGDDEETLERALIR